MPFTKFIPSLTTTTCAIVAALTFGTAIPAQTITIVAGTIDMSASQRVAEVDFSESYQNGTQYWIRYRYAAPCDETYRTPPAGYNEFRPIWFSFGDPAGYAGPCLNNQQVPSSGGRVRGTIGAQLNVIFLITEWKIGIHPAEARSIEMQLGSQTRVAEFGAKEITFENVAGGELPLVLIVRGGLFRGDEPIDVRIPGLLPLQIEFE